MKSMELNNKVCKPSRSIAMEAKASKCLNYMLKGGRINRATLDEIGISAKNDSAHTMISTLRNQRYIPIISERTENNTCDYYMAPEEIIRYQDPILRKQQREEMKAHTEQKQANKTIEKTLNFLTRARHSKTLQRYVVKNSKIKMKNILREINALLNSQEQEKR